MGSNSTQAIGLLLFLLAFTALAGAFAGGGLILLVLALGLLGGAAFFLIKCKPLEHQE